MKVGDMVILTGRTIASRYFGKAARIVQIEAGLATLITVTVMVPSQPRILVFPNEIKMYEGLENE